MRTVCVALSAIYLILLGASMCPRLQKNRKHIELFLKDKLIETIGNCYQLDNN